MFILGLVYISPLTDIISVLSSLKEKLNIISQKYVDCSIIIGGDFSGRVGDKNNHIDENMLFNLDITCNRISRDLFQNKRGKILLESMEDSGFFILNGRSMSDSPANFTNISPLGCSVIDQVWVNGKALDFVVDFKVYDIPVISCHFPIAVKIKNFNNLSNKNSEKPHVK